MTPPTTSTTRRRIVRLTAALAVAVTASALGGWAFSAAAAESQPAESGSGDAQRIEFASGTDSATVTGSIAPGSTARYVLRASAGQTMYVEVGPDQFAALTTIFGPDGNVVGAGHNAASAVLPGNGDYIIEIGNTGSTTDYTLSVGIPAETPDPGGDPGEPGTTSPPSDDYQRIEFAPGADSATVTGSIAPGADATYVFRASAGQAVYVDISPDEFLAETFIWGEGELASGGNSVTATLPEDGDYVIGVYNRGTTTDFTLMVHIPAEAPDPGDAQRIEFAPGTDNATVTGSIAPGSTARYVLHASAGQTMYVEVGPDQFAALTTIFGPDGDVVGAGHNAASAVLPGNGDYVIEIGNTGSTTDYTLSVGIPAESEPGVRRQPPGTRDRREPRCGAAGAAFARGSVDLSRRQQLRPVRRPQLRHRRARGRHRLVAAARHAVPSR